MGNTSSDLSKKYKKVSPVREVMSLLVQEQGRHGRTHLPDPSGGGITFRRSAVDYESQVDGAEHF